MSDQVCGFEKDDGDACEVAFGLCKCHGWCWTHAPCKAEERQAARSRGGYSSADKRRKFRGVEAPWPLKDISDAKRWLEEIGRLVLRRDVPPKVAHAAVRCVEGWISAEKDELAMEDLEELREAVEELKRREQVKAV